MKENQGNVKVIKAQSGLIQVSGLEEEMKMAGILVKSGMLPKHYDSPEKVLVARQLAIELGLRPISALRQIAVINGSPSVWGDLPLSMVMSSNKLEGITEHLIDKNLKKICAENNNQAAEVFGAICVVQRKGLQSSERTFTMDDAKRAGLLGKGTWNQYPKRMLQLRARSWNLKDNFPDVLNGISIAEYDYDLTEEGITEGVQKVSMQERPSPISLALDAAPKERLISLIPALDANELEDFSPEPIEEVIQQMESPFTPEPIEINETEILAGSKAHSIAEQAQKKLEEAAAVKKENYDFTVKFGRYAGKKLKEIPIENLVALASNVNKNLDKATPDILPNVKEFLSESARHIQYRFQEESRE